jgi:hypothetical protein
MSKIRTLLLSLIAASALSVAPIAISQASAHHMMHHHHHMMAPAPAPACGGVIGSTFGCIFY